MKTITQQEALELVNRARRAVESGSQTCEQALDSMENQIKADFRQATQVAPRCHFFHRNADHPGAGYGSSNY